ncbi:hypothetical protein ACWGI8_34200 [Streptomyces sp. NPDC054841]
MNNGAWSEVEEHRKTLRRTLYETCARTEDILGLHAVAGAFAEVTGVPAPGGARR